MDMFAKPKKVRRAEKDAGFEDSLKSFDFRKYVMNHYCMKALDTLTISEKGHTFVTDNAKHFELLSPHGLVVESPLA